MVLGSLPKLNQFLGVFFLQLLPQFVLYGSCFLWLLNPDKFLFLLFELGDAGIGNVQTLFEFLDLGGLLNQFLIVSLLLLTFLIDLFLRPAIITFGHTEELGV